MEVQQGYSQQVLRFVRYKIYFIKLIIRLGCGDKKILPMETNLGST